MIVVFDSGVWISALQFEGIPLVAVESALNKHRVAICDPILGEVRSTLEEKFGWTKQELDEILAFYHPSTFAVRIRGELRGICRDPKDDMILECAVVAKADLIVSGDKDLLVLKQHRGIRILNPRAFLEEAPSP